MSEVLIGQDRAAQKRQVPPTLILWKYWHFWFHICGTARVFGIGEWLRPLVCRRDVYRFKVSATNPDEQSAVLAPTPLPFGASSQSGRRPARTLVLSYVVVLVSAHHGLPFPQSAETGERDGSHGGSDSFNSHCREQRRTRGLKTGEKRRHNVVDSAKRAKSEN